MERHLIVIILLLCGSIYCQAQDNLKKFMCDSIRMYSVNALSTGVFSHISQKEKRSIRVYTFDEARDQISPELIEKLKNTFWEDSKNSAEASFYIANPDSLFYIMTFGGKILETSDLWKYSMVESASKALENNDLVDSGAMFSVGRDSVSFAFFYTLVKDSSNIYIPYSTLTSYMEQAYANNIASYHPVKYLSSIPEHAMYTNKNLNIRLCYTDSTFMGKGVTTGCYYEIKKPSVAKKMFAQLTVAVDKLFFDVNIFFIRKSVNKINITSPRTQQCCVIELNKDGSLSYMFVQPVTADDRLYLPEGNLHKYHYSYKGQLFEEVPKEVLDVMNQE